MTFSLIFSQDEVPLYWCGGPITFYSGGIIFCTLLRCITQTGLIKSRTPISRQDFQGREDPGKNKGYHKPDAEEVRQER